MSSHIITNNSVVDGEYRNAWNGSKLALREVASGYAFSCMRMSISH